MGLQINPRVYADYVREALSRLNDAASGVRLVLDYIPDDTMPDLEHALMEYGDYNANAQNALREEGRRVSVLLAQRSNEERLNDLLSG